MGSVRPLHAVASLLLLAACFSESGAGTTGAACPDGSSGCPCFGNGTCDDGLECSMGACVMPGCTPGELACNCFENQCFGSLLCEGGACHAPPAATEGSGPSSEGPTTTAASTVDTTVTDSTTTGASTDTGLVVCGDAPECVACKDCAALGPCAEPLATCQLDPECAALVACLSACREGDDVCGSDCGMTHADGTALFEPFASCVVCECMTPCPTKAQCP